MTAADMIQTQITDIFRIGLIIALVFTMLRTQATTGTVIPLAAGVLFIAILIPNTMKSLPGESMLRQVLMGLVSNAIILAIVITIFVIVQRLRGP